MAGLHEIFKILDGSPLGQISKPLGHLCMAWSWLELEIDTFLIVLVTPDDYDIGAAIVYNMDFRDKLRAALATGFIKKPSDDWYDELKSAINEIDNDLRKERNRMIHDSWHHTGSDIFRLTNYAKVEHEQARKLVIHFGEGKPIKPSDIYVLMMKIFAAGGHLDNLLGRYLAAQPKPSPDKDA